MTFALSSKKLQFVLPQLPILPTAESVGPGVRRWLESFYQIQQSRDAFIAEAFDILAGHRTIVGAIADRPDPVGSGVTFIANDDGEETQYVDLGTWVELTETITVENPFTGTLPDGGIRWEDSKIKGSQVKLLGVSNLPDWEQFQDDGAGSTGVYTWHFDKNTLEQVFYDDQITHMYKAGSEIRPHIHWAPTTAGGGVVKWGVELTWAAKGDVFPTTETWETLSPAEGVARRYQTSEFDPVTLPEIKESTFFLMRLYRDAADGEDTYDADAAWLGFDFHLQHEKMGTTGEHTGS